MDFDPIVNKISSIGTAIDSRVNDPNNFDLIWQNYRTKPIFNNRLALYKLSIRDCKAPHGSVYDYTFPISPQNMKISNNALNTIFDVPSQNYKLLGVERIVDQYGNTMPIFTIEGTTGWQYHSNDGFKYTGIESIQNLRFLLDAFQLLNQKQIENQMSDLYTLEFYDYFAENFWEVVPVGDIIIRQSEDRPIFHYFTLSFAVTRDVWASIQKPTAPNPIDQMFELAASNVVNTVKKYAGMITGAYGEITGVIS